MNASWTTRYQAMERLGREAGKIALGYYHKGAHVETKPDDSPVTIADKSAEKYLRDELTKLFPGDGFLGEEYGNEPGTTGYRWIIDPIDGTRCFIRKIPHWATLVGLEYQGEIVAGITYEPCFDRMYKAARGEGAFCDGEPIRVSGVPDLKDTLACYSGFNFFKQAERGREVAPFIQDVLGEEGMARTVVIVAKCDESPLMRVRASQAAIAIADHFRDEGKNVLFMIDSLTRLAMAQREIGQMRGEVPGPKGYTSSCFQMLATTIERLGNGARGGITALLTVLVDGGDLDEPISDSVRSLVDGHIILDRKMAEKNIYPAVNVLKSVSRVQNDIVDESHQDAAAKLRTIIATLEESQELVRIGMYKKGSDVALDKALELKAAVESFVKQKTGERSTAEQTRRELLAITSQWPY